jgi:hypothetical protein
MEITKPKSFFKTYQMQCPTIENVALPTEQHEESESPAGGKKSKLAEIPGEINILPGEPHVEVCFHFFTKFLQ